MSKQDGFAAPLDVTNVNAVSVTKDSFTVSWTNSTSANITEYRVVVNNGTSNIINQTSASPYTANGLLPGVNYTITIYAIDNTGTSSPGSTKSVTTLPSSVSDFQVTAVGTNEMNLSWTIPGDINKDTYRYFVITQPGDINSTSTTNAIHITGLSPGTNYTFTIFTLTQNGVKSQTSQQTTNTTKPSAITTLVVVSTSENSVILKWNSSSDPSSSAYTYTVEGGRTSESGIKANTAEIKNLDPGTTYNFTVFAVTPNGVSSAASNVASATTRSRKLNLRTRGLSKMAAGTEKAMIHPALLHALETGPWHHLTCGRGPDQVHAIPLTAPQNPRTSATATPLLQPTVPSTVTNVQITIVSDTSVNLTWTPSSDQNNSSYTYTVKYGSNNKTDIKASTVGITGLFPGTDYSFTVYAVTSNGITSKPSTAANTTTRMIFIFPTPVTCHSALHCHKRTDNAVSDTSVNLTWTPSSDPNNSSYTYTVKYGSSNKTDITTSSTWITGLSPGTDYSFTVYAVTINGITSKPSTAANTTT
ncbi:unnamed protein product, partial [Ranitomeya imitator]